MIEITDLALAAYYYLRNKSIVDRKRSPKNRNQWIFVFAMSEEEHHVMSLEFANSEFRRYDDAQRMLKKLVH